MDDGVDGEGGERQQSECVHSFHCSAEWKIKTEGASSSRGFPAPATEEEGDEGGREWGGQTA